jgi:hypothetical protein
MTAVTFPMTPAERRAYRAATRARRLLLKTMTQLAAETREQANVVRHLLACPQRRVGR